MKKLGEFIKNHKLLVIILAAVIFFTALWTPVIIILSRQSKTEGSSSLVNASSSSIISTGDYSVVSSEESQEESGESEQSESSSSSSKDESSSKKESSSEDSSGNKKKPNKVTTPQNTVPEKPETEEDPIDANAPRIICWGDSITQGMGMDEGDDYPAVLQRLVGNGYRVLNAGSGGEKSQTIAARQGAYNVYLKADLVFKSGYGSITLDDENGFVLEDGTLLDINEDGESFRNDVPCKKIYIDGKEYELYANGKNIEILREEYNSELVLKKGSQVVFESAEKQKGSYCEIFYVSANDDGNREGDAEDVQYLINRYKAMINRHGNDCYMVIIPQWAGGYTEPLKAEFGDRAVDIKAEICQRVIDKNGYLSSDEDIKEAKQGKIPTSLKYENNPKDSLHLNQDGYKMMGNIIYENGVKLGFWK